MPDEVNRGRVNEQEAIGKMKEELKLIRIESVTHRHSTKNNITIMHCTVYACRSRYILASRMEPVCRVVCSDIGRRQTHPITHADEDTQTGIQRDRHLLKAREEEVISVHACEHVCHIST